MTIPFIIYIILFHILALITTTFPIVYLRSNWNRNPGGRALMLFSTSIAAVCDATVLSFWFARFLDVDGVRIVGWFLIAYAIVACTYLLVQLIKSQRATRRN